MVQMIIFSSFEFVKKKKKKIGLGVIIDKRENKTEVWGTVKTAAQNLRPTH
jgi:methionine synthase II (cobalamin-independent)